MDSDKVKYFFPKLKNRLRDEKNRLWKYVNLDCISMNGYTPFANGNDFRYRLHTMLGVFDVITFKDINKEEKTIIINSAEKILRHEFDFLGSGPVVLDPIDWHVDFKCGTRWKKKFYREICFIEGADIKVPWELNRCQHLLWLGEAYLFTGEAKYAQEIIEEINWWIDDNPMMYSVNWKCAMDVAFRAVNWMFALNMISSYEGFDEQFAQKVSRSLWQHGFFIWNNLEKTIPYSNNHYTSDLVGLLYIGELFGKTRKGVRWLSYGLKEFFSEIRIQVLPSGIHYERSVSYHRMMTEMLSYPLYMLQRMGEIIPKDIIERISNMYSYISIYTKPNGLAPLIGDNDDGRFVPLLKRDFRNHGYLLQSDSVENRVVSLGQPLIKFDVLNESKVFSDAGTAIIKDGSNYLFVNNGNYSRCFREDQMYIGTHTHNDALSFELALNGEDIIVDPGTYLYTSSKKKRDAFRSTVKHNTVVVDNEEQNGFVDSFIVHRNIQQGVIKIDKGVISSEYKMVNSGMKHKREFLLLENRLLVTDSIEKMGKQHKAVFYYHIASGVTPKLLEDKIILNDIITMSFNKTPSLIKIEDDTLSPSFGKIVSSKTISVLYNFDNELLIETTIKG